MEVGLEVYQSAVLSVVDGDNPSILGAVEEGLPLPLPPRPSHHLEEQAQVQEEVSPQERNLDLHNQLITMVIYRRTLTVRAMSTAIAMVSIY